MWETVQIGVQFTANLLQGIVAGAAIIFYIIKRGEISSVVAALLNSSLRNSISSIRALLQKIEMSAIDDAVGKSEVQRSLAAIGGRVKANPKLKQCLGTPLLKRIGALSEEEGPIRSTDLVAVAYEIEELLSGLEARNYNDAK